MHRYGPCCLPGPITQDRPWWNRSQRRSRKRSKPVDPGIRTDLVERVRREIADGTYETPERWEAALNRLADSL